MLVLGSLIVGIRANDRMMKRARDSGHRYWLVNPRASLAGVRGPEPFIFALALAIGFLSAVALSALN